MLVLATVPLRSFHTGNSLPSDKLITLWKTYHSTYECISTIAYEKQILLKFWQPTGNKSQLREAFHTIVWTWQLRRSFRVPRYVGRDTARVSAHNISPIPDSFTPRVSTYCQEICINFFIQPCFITSWPLAYRNVVFCVANMLCCQRWSTRKHNI